MRALLSTFPRALTNVGLVGYWVGTTVGIKVGELVVQVPEPEVVTTALVVAQERVTRLLVM